MNTSLLKLTFISGLQEVVLAELSHYSEIKIYEQTQEELYIEPIQNFEILQQLRSVTNIYVVERDNDLNPHFISKHKSLLGKLIDTVLGRNTNVFKTFKLSCAGQNSKEVTEIKKFISNTYKLTSTEDADLEIFIGKSNNTWEMGVRTAPRPLTLRDYKVENIKGGLNPTIAYAINSFCDFKSAQSYLNIFSGSATLLIEAGLSKKELRLVGFDINGTSNALAIKNIKKSGLIKSIQLKTADIFTEPDLGKFDVITSDLPFGMQISKDEDLEKLYESFVRYSEKYLNPQGTLVVYTTEHKLLETTLTASKFIIVKTVSLKVSTIVDAYIHPKIFVCKLK